MKKLSLVFVLAVALPVTTVLAVALTSCQAPQVRSSDRLTIDNISAIHVVHFEGHEYLASEIQSAGSLCHSESCPGKIK